MNLDGYADVWNVQRVLLSEACQISMPTTRLKHLLISAYRDSLAAAYDSNIICVETGTLHGETTAFLSNICEKVITIEAHEPLFVKAQVLRPALSADFHLDLFKVKQHGVSHAA